MAGYTFNPSLIKTMIVQARDQASEWGSPDRSTKYQVVNRALVAAEEMMTMIQARVGRNLDKGTLRAGIAILKRMDEANLPGEIEEIVAQPTPMSSPVYRLSIPDLSGEEDGPGAIEALQIIGTREQLETLLAFVKVPSDYFAQPADKEEGE